MKPSSFAYHRPQTLDECCTLLSRFGGDAAILAGGQSLLSLMRFRMAQPANLISIADLPDELSIVREKGDTLVIPARVTYAQAQRSDVVRRWLPGLPEAIQLVATPAVRSRGTICGNLCNADPASELPAFALAMDAQFRLASSAGERVVPASEFFVGPYTTARAVDEFLVSVEFPRRPAGEAVCTLETVRLAGGFPMAGVTVAATGGADGILRKVVIACFGVNSVQIRAVQAESDLEGRVPGPQDVERAEESLDAAIHPHTDAFASSDFRRSLVRTLFRRAVNDVSVRVTGQ